MTARKFDRLILSALGGAVLVTAAASMVNPAKGVTASPRVSFDIASAETAHLNDGTRRSAPDATEVASLSASPSIEAIRESQALAETFEQMGYHFDRVRDEGAPVPRVFLAELPQDLHAVPEVSLKKTVFFQTMLPLILKVNERILQDRKRLMDIKVQKALGHKLSATDRLWLAVLAERYKVSDENIAELMRRVDIIPPSLAMAQAAEESGWGTSRFARNGNALFGQWTTESDEGLVPHAREEDRDHKIKSFGTLTQSVASYMRNLNTHRAYRELRKLRAKLRAKGAPLDGYVLAGTLTRYSERGEKYIKNVRIIIDANNLLGLDDARLIDEHGEDQSA